MPARRIDVIANRNARHLEGDRGLIGVLRDAARAAGATMHETRGVGELEVVARRIAHAGTDAVVLAGGDGSYMAGASALTRAFGGSPPPLALVPAGTVSTVARNWGFRGDARDYSVRLLGAIARGTARGTLRPTLQVRDGAARDHVGFIFGAGLVASFFDAYYASSVQGYAGAAAIVARVFAGAFVRGRLAAKILEPVPMRLTVDGETETPDAYSLVAASVVRDLGLHMHLLPRAGSDPARFHVVASPLPPRALAPQLWRVLAGLPLCGPHNVDALADRVRVALGARDGRGPYVLDGEVFESSWVEVQPGPSFLQLSPCHGAR